MGTIERARLDEDGDSARRLQAAARGDRAAWGAVLAQHREKAPGRMVALRMDRRLTGRVDPSDVIQDAYLEAARRLPDYIRETAPICLFLLAALSHRQSLQTLHRRFLGAWGRDAGWPRNLDRRRPHSSGDLGGARRPASGPRHPRQRSSHPRPSASSASKEALNSMDPIDRRSACAAVRPLRATVQYRVRPRSPS